MSDRPSKSKDSLPNDLSSKSEFSTMHLLVPKTVPKRHLTFENDELEDQALNTIKSSIQNDSFNPNQTFNADEEEDNPEDEFISSVEIPETVKIPEKEAIQIEMIRVIKNFINHQVYVVFLNMVILYVLIADYFRIMLFNVHADIYFDLITIFCFFSLLGDFLLSLATQKRYFLSFYFFIDFVMTFSIIFDITLVINAVFEGKSDGVQLATTNILNIIRVIRLIRIMKFLRSKQPSQQMSDVANKVVQNAIRKSEFGDKNKGELSLAKRIFAPKESKVATQLKDMNIRRIIIIVLLILIVVPLFDFSLYYQDRSQKVFDKAVYSAYNFMSKNNSLANSTLVDGLISLDDSKLDLIQFIIFDVYNYTDPDIKTLRPDEMDNFQGTIFVDGTVFGVSIVISHKRVNIIQALLNLLNTIFVSLIMIGSIISLNNDMSSLVLNPLERMINKIKLIAINPILALKTTRVKGDENSDTNETYIIESAINKITGLLMLGFGQAGCKIVSGFVLDANRDIDKLIPGEKTYAIFGFCDIKGFSDVTEVLVEDIMLFVNTIADIVHQGVDEFAGSTNKNIGEAFLMVWKLMDNGYKYLIDSDYKEYVSLLPPNEFNQLVESISVEDRYNRQLAEFAVLGFAKVLMEVHTNPKILKFSNNELIREKMPNYEVMMSFGLHIGWAIEGAIGSSYKIDASYLSPNVNLASRVQYACKQFSLSLLFSGNVFDLFTNPQMISNGRHIDTVNLKGSKQPIKLYTFDFSLKRLKKWKEDTKNCVKIKNIKIDIKENMRDQFLDILQKKSTETDLAHTLIKNKNQLKKFSSMVDESLVTKKLCEPDFIYFFDFDNAEQTEFRGVSKFAVETYLSGDWKSAKSLFEKCLRMSPQDGPVQTIYKYMQGENFKAPSNWKNCREMTEK